MNAAAYERLFATFAFVLGTIVGSFLNVCIYRLPLGLSVNEPRRSFCPLCKAPIAWYHNLPLLGWLWLRGRCAKCQAPISVRYPAIEGLTGVLFLSAWLQGPWLLAPFYWVFISLLIVGTFIDFEHFIIPDEITIGGTIVGVLVSLAVPQLMGTDSHLMGLLWSLAGALAGFATLFAVVELGKLAFGRKRIVLPEPENFTWQRRAEEDDADLRIGEEPPDRWSDLFSREKDQLVLECETLTLAGTQHENVSLLCFYNRLQLGPTTYPLEKVDTFSGRVRQFVIPREAMGFGDVKFIACIGAFLGWQAVFFTIAAGSMIGSILGLALMLFGPKARSAKLPFGPYLAAGALLWLFAGPELVGWYWGWVHS